MANMSVQTFHSLNQPSLRNTKNRSISYKTASQPGDGQNTPYASCPPTMEAATPGMLQSASTGSAEPQPTGLYRSVPTAPPRRVSRRTQVDENSSKPFIEIFMCFFCEGEFRQKHLLQMHQKECDLIPPQFKGAVPYLSHTHKRPEKVQVIPRKRRKLIEDKVTFPCKHLYIESLGLLPQAKAESVRRQSQGRKVDCDVIEVDGSKRPKTPSTPRTPKSLMSQLSRDVSPPARVRLKISDDSDKEDEEGSTESSEDEEQSEAGKSPKGDKYRPRRAVTLLSIDISSLLGKRVMKHIDAYYANLDNYQTSLDASSNQQYENFCRTPTKSKVVVTERLRSRGKDGFQVTFKKTKRTAPDHCHVYKFQRSQLAEHCRIVETGLNRRSRALKRQVKKCKVVLSKLSPKDLKRWTKQRRGAPNKLSLTDSKSLPNKQVVFSKFFDSIGNPSLSLNNKPSVFPPLVPPGSHQQEIKRLLMASTTGQSASVSRQLQLSMMADESISSGTMQQNLLYRNLLMASSSPEQPTTTSRQLRLSMMADETLNSGTMQQKLMYRNLISGSSPATAVTGTAGDLTPPSTPEQASPIMVDDDDIICLDDCASYTQRDEEKQQTLSRQRSSSARTNLSTKISAESTSLNKRKQKTTSKVQEAVVVDNSKDDDVISISSTESTSDITIVSPESLKRRCDWTPEGNPQTKRRRMDQGRPAALLFRCHLCFEEITCHDNANVYIKGHFAKSHSVYNIDLIEHLDANGQKVVSIVEVPTPEKQPPPSSFILTNRANNSTSVVPTQFYGGHNTDRKKTKTSARTKQQAKPKAGPTKTKPTAKKLTSTSKASAKKIISSKATKTGASSKQAKAVQSKGKLPSKSTGKTKNENNKDGLNQKKKIKVVFTVTKSKASQGKSVAAKGKSVKKR